MQFTGNKLNRSSTNKKSAAFFSECINKPDGRWVLYRNMKVYFRQQPPPNEDTFKLNIISVEQVLAILKLENKQQLLQYFFESIIILGEINEMWYFAINLSHLTNEDLSFIQQSKEITAFINAIEMEGRKLLVGVSQSEAAIAGQVLSLFSFHRSHQYLGLTGEMTRCIEGGHKRMGLESGIKIYPRLDPVMIACVLSPDCKKCLLGHMKHFPKGFYSCLSGFIEPCESVQEAVAREIYEESGVEIEHIYIIDSQPWPLGRGGGCELMIGCLAIAKTTQIVINDPEVADVNWFTQSQIKTLIDKYSGKSYHHLNTEIKSWEDNQLKLASVRQERSLTTSSTSSGSECEGTMEDAEIEHIRIPGDYAIAHHLLRRYANREYDMYLPKRHRHRNSTSSVHTFSASDIHLQSIDTTHSTHTSTTSTSTSASINKPEQSKFNKTSVDSNDQRFWKVATLVSSTTAVLAVAVAVYAVSGGQLSELKNIRSLKDLELKIFCAK